MNKFTIDSTIGEIIGEIKGTPPSDLLLDLVGQVIRKLSPQYRWYIDRSLINNEIIDITMRNPYETKFTSLSLNENIGYEIHRVVLTLTHHNDWHKGITVGSVTVKPYEWYPSLNKQLKYLKDNPEMVDKLYKNARVSDLVDRIKVEIKNGEKSH